jgi:hypothetical protein
VRVEVCVQHQDREIEFHLLKADVERVLVAPMDFGRMSCEHIATMLADQLEVCGVRASAIEVWEDGENGARVEF